MLPVFGGDLRAGGRPGGGLKRVYMCLLGVGGTLKIKLWRRRLWLIAVACAARSIVVCVLCFCSHTCPPLLSACARIVIDCVSAKCTKNTPGVPDVDVRYAFRYCCRDAGRPSKTKERTTYRNKSAFFFLFFFYNWANSVP